jgi:hypothetical protein
MAKLSPFLTKPAQWVEELGLLTAEMKKLEAREEKLRGRLKLHMQEKGVNSLKGDKFEFKVLRGEKSDISIDAILETFGPDAITKLPKKKTEQYRLVEIKPKDAGDKRADEIVKHFSK